jgi:hypothetical protein
MLDESKKSKMKIIKSICSNNLPTYKFKKRVGLDFVFKDNYFQLKKIYEIMVIISVGWGMFILTFYFFQFEHWGGTRVFKCSSNRHIG